MKTLISIAAILLVSCCRGVVTPTEALVTEIIAGKVDHVDCFFTPDDLVTRVAISEQALERIASKMTVKLRTKEASVSKLLAALKGIQNNPDTVRLDLRFGFKFYDGESVMVHSLYIDSDRRNGTYDGKAVFLNAEIVDWLNEARKRSSN